MPFIVYRNHWLSFPILSYWKEHLFQFTCNGYVSENSPYLCDFPMQMGAFNTPKQFLNKYTTDSDINLNFTEFTILLKLL